MTILVAIKPIKSLGNYFPVGSVIDPSECRRVKTKAREGKIAVIDLSIPLDSIKHKKAKHNLARIGKTIEDYVNTPKSSHGKGGIQEENVAPKPRRRRTTTQS